MKLVLGGISILIGFAAGAFMSAHISSEFKQLDELCHTLEELKILICSYSLGFGKAITDGKLDKKCALFDSVAKQLCSEGASLSESISNAPFNDEIKVCLARLFDTIIRCNEVDIAKSFDATIDTVEKYRAAEHIKKEKNAPLYKKAGLLLGLGAAILLM